ncbi:MAG: hypothetical protein M1816_008120 [Peltula sp. TS41687]|nr:MAG: hypothetical protein M1816_008120 [Peltula sp. TS41687]
MAITMAQDDHAEAAREHSLPLPPMMDPVKIAARKKHRSIKRRPSSNDRVTPLQRQLRNNPYANTLATPLRICSLTQLHLPNFFLVGFNLVAHPTTDELWMLPSGLAPPTIDSPPGSAETGAADSDHHVSGESDAHGSQNDNTAKTKPTSSKPTSPSSYALAKSFMLQRVEKDSKLKRNWSKLVRVRMGERYPLERKELKWPKKLNDTILRLLRLRVVYELAYLASRPETGYMMGGKEGLEAIASKGRVGCVLWLGPQTLSSSSVAGESDLPDDGPKTNEELPSWLPTIGSAPCMTMVGDGTYSERVVVYHLPQLLGTEFLVRLRAKLGQCRGQEVVVLRCKKTVVRAQMWLWKLQGYLSDEPSGIRG